LLSVLFFSLSAQRGNVKLDKDQLESFRYQCEALVKYYEETLNFLGDSATLPKERQIVINDSYHKIFKDDEVQIEDDLISDRITVFYKDVKAYLRDVNFFYKNVQFKYHVQNIDPFYNEKGQLSFRATANRAMSGVNIKGETHEDNMARYIEIEYDADREDLKIVSIYTTQLGDTEDLANWWLALPDFWRMFFSRETILDGGIRLSDVVTFSDTTISFRMDSAFLNNIKNELVFFKDSQGFDSIPYALRIEKPVKKGKKNDPDPKPDSLITIMYPGKNLQPLVAKIIKQSDINLEGEKGFIDLAPLAKMTNLAYISLNGTDITDLMTLRNMNKLESLKISNTGVSDLSPLNFLINLRIIDASGSAVSDISSLSDNLGLTSVNISNTKVSDIAPLSSLPSLHELYLDGSHVKDLKPLEKTTTLEKLTFNDTEVGDISALENLKNLTLLEMDRTKVVHLAPCAEMNKLQKISFEKTPVANFEALDQLEALRFIYCNDTKTPQSHILDFIYKNPKILTVFNTQEMETWWSLLTPYWQEYFSGRVGFYQTPTRENLAEIVALDRIDIANRQTVSDIGCFNKLYMLQSLHATLSGINSLTSLSDLPYLRKIDISYTTVNDVTTLKSLPRLDTLLANNTRVKNIAALKNISTLRLIECDATDVPDKDAEELRSVNPNCLVIYRTNRNQKWWNELNDTWKTVLADTVSNPNKYQLQQILNSETFDATNNRSITDLSPLNSFYNLKKVVLKGSMVANLKPIANNKTITYLDISNTPVVSIDELSNLTNIDTLNIENTQIKKFDVIADLTNLKYLEISGTQIKNLKPLSSLSKLQEVGFSNTAISNITPLNSLPNLKRVKAFRTKISDRSIETFKKENPNCEVIYY
jgi:hypothetical protein